MTHQNPTGTIRVIGGRGFLLPVPGPSSFSRSRTEVGYA